MDIATAGNVGILPTCPDSRVKTNSCIHTLKVLIITDKRKKEQERRKQIRKEENKKNE